jgi:MinD superfamily P-loop ATPase
MKEIVILSGKGGTGKTSISAAFATLQANTIMADCDVDAANLYLILQPNNYREETYISGNIAVIDYNICIACAKCVTYCRFEAISVINDKVEISSTACEGCQLCARICPVGAISMLPSDNSRWYIGTYRNGSVVHARLAPGEENSGKLVSVVRNQARKVAEEKKQTTVLLDGPPGTGCPVISSLTGADKSILVTEPTKSGFHDLKRIAALVQNFKVKPFVLINKYDLNTALSDEIENWCNAQAIPVVGKLPFDTKVVEAMIQCKSITEYAPTCEVSNILKQVYDKVINED